MTYPEEGGRDFRDDAAEPGDGWPSDRVDRNDMAERSREGLAGGFLSAVRRRAFVPGAKSGGSPASPWCERVRWQMNIAARAAA